jgi:hypothetical protein
MWKNVPCVHKNRNPKSVSLNAEHSCIFELSLASNTSMSDDSKAVNHASKKAQNHENHFQGAAKWGMEYDELLNKQCYERVLFQEFFYFYSIIFSIFSHHMQHTQIQKQASKQLPSPIPLPESGPTYPKTPSCLHCAHLK